MEDTEKFVEFARSEWQKDEPEDREYVILQGSEIIGGINLEKCENRSGNTFEIGWIICRDKRGQGFATEAAMALMAYAFNELNADFVRAHCDSRNTASEGVMKKLGMTLTDGTGTRTYPKTGVTSGESAGSVAALTSVRLNVLWKISSSHSAKPFEITVKVCPAIRNLSPSASFPPSVRENISAGRTPDQR